MTSAPRTMAERLLALGWMSADICRAESEQDLLVAAGRHVHGLFDVDWVGVGLRASSGRRVRLIALPRSGQPIDRGTDLPVEGLALDEVAANGSNIFEPDVASSSYRDLVGLAAAGMRSALVVPLRVAAHTVGAMALARSGPQVFVDDDRLLARQAAAFMASAITNLRALTAANRAQLQRHKAEMILVRRASELDALNQLLAAMDTMSLRQVVDRFATDFAALRGIELCRVTAVDRSGAIRVVSTASDDGEVFGDAGPVVPASSPEGIAIATNRIALWRRPEPDDTEAIGVLRSLGVSSLFSMPITWRDEPIGAFTAGSTGPSRFVTDEHINMAEIVGRRLAELINDGPTARQAWAALTTRETSELSELGV